MKKMNMVIAQYTVECAWQLPQETGRGGLPEDLRAVPLATTVAV